MYIVQALFSPILQQQEHQNFRNLEFKTDILEFRETRKKSFQSNTGLRLLSLHSLLFPAFIASRPNWLEKNKKLLQ